MSILALPSDPNSSVYYPGFVCLGIVVALGVALFFLVRSMNKQISRIEAPKEADIKQAEWEARQAALKDKS